MNKIKVADQAWIGLALLHHELGHQDFRTEEVLHRAEKEFGTLQPGVRQHLGSHAVASIPPTPGRYRMFTRTGHGRLRLFRRGDAVHALRNGKAYPSKHEIPAKFWHLLDWYQAVYDARPQPQAEKGSSDPKAFLAMVGLIPAYDLKIIEDLIESDCENIENNPQENTDVA